MTNWIKSICGKKRKSENNILIPNVSEADIIEIRNFALNLLRSSKILSPSKTEPSLILNSTEAPLPGLP